MGALKKWIVDWLIKDSVNGLIKAIQALDGNKTSLGLLGIIVSGILMYLGGPEHVPMGDAILRVLEALPKLTEREVPLTPADVNTIISQLLLIGGIIGKVYKAVKGQPQSPEIVVTKIAK